MSGQIHAATTKEDSVSEQDIFESLAWAHPREMNAHDPARFWRFFHREFPEVSREVMERMLSEP
jgi:hypothetical protein